MTEGILTTSLTIRVTTTATATKEITQDTRGFVPPKADGTYGDVLTRNLRSRRKLESELGMGVEGWMTHDTRSASSSSVLLALSYDAAKESDGDGDDTT
eukprot:CAMPEP_0204634418 /NCGR_PEP_ID=MMETSP0717-20131115/29231_1 /ASSEMBLY_ACC=CAM_ASM_000666 /TAXON_ID=230516 /ORGANISM="Chaetoceros curvisetus" /LENGTH=98 /DNA_ID=CAMNT_0051652847 /DNA_START=34 /DNA_END=327 /DNA_ORIENTATION=-